MLLGAPGEIKYWDLISHSLAQLLRYVNAAFINMAWCLYLSTSQFNAFAECPYTKNINENCLKYVYAVSDLI